MTQNNFKNKIVIYSGSFNPPHIGHAVAVEATTRLFPCREIWIMPSADRRDKKISVSGEHRFKMTQLLFQEMFPQSKVPLVFSRMELDRPIPTATFDTYKELQVKYPKKDFYFLVGSDIVGDIEAKWENGRELARLANFLVFNRYGHNWPVNLPANFICLDKEVVGLDISSTFIRSLLLKGYSGLPYLTSAVKKYIKKNKLYN